MTVPTLVNVYDLLKLVAVEVGVRLPDEPESPVTPPYRGILFPEGDIQTRGLNGQPYNVPWANIARWEPAITDAVEALGNPYHPLLLAAFIVIESQGKHYTHNGLTGTSDEVIRGNGDARSRGLLQIRCDLHSASDMDRCLNPQRHIALGAGLLANWIRSEGSWEAALANKWHPGTDPASGIGPPAYIRIVRDLIAEVKAVWPEASEPDEPGGPEPRNPFPRPIIYELATDFARYGLPGTPLTREMVNTILGNRFLNRSGARPRFIVNHIQDGTTPGSLNWWATGPGVQASSTVMANRDGSILRIIPEEHGAWTNGDVCNPTPKSAALRALGGNPNIHCLTLEAEGRPGINTVSYTPAQEQAICWQYADWIIRYDMGKAEQVVLSHASINFCSRQNCPGEANQLQILARLKAAGL